MMRAAQSRIGHALLTLAVAACLASVWTSTQAQDEPVGDRTAIPTPSFAPEEMLDQYCSRCHNEFDEVAGLSIDDLKAGDLAHGENVDRWEKVLRKVATGEMPPDDKPQPEPVQRAAFTTWLATARGHYAAANPDPGLSTVRRLNRVEYANAVRDLLALDVDFRDELPQDNSGFGFDNIADVLSVSPTLMERYVAVAGKISRMATGIASARVAVTSYQVPKDGSVGNSGVPAYNERASADLPLGSRGGGAFRYFAPYDGEYDVIAWLNSNSNNETDRETEDRYSLRVPMTAGPHLVGMSFRRRIAPEQSVQTVRNDTDKVPLPLAAPTMLPLDVWVDGKKSGELSVPSYRMHERYAQQNFPRDVLQIDVAGPYDAKGSGQTANREQIFACRPQAPSAEPACARRIATSLARRAWRASGDAIDTAPLLAIYEAERKSGDFEQGIAAMVQAVLVSPRFLFLVESDPANAAPGSVHSLSDHELAARLALFLWSSIPDEPLLLVADKGTLHRPEVLRKQARRMLDDPRADALTKNFAGQWLFLRNLEQQRPDIAIFPDFDVRLRQAMATETESFFDHVVRTNRPVLDFIKADYAFLNQRLADHYGIPGVHGDAFRKVALDPAWHRGGLLGQASILTVTSYGNHTSVVKRGKWVLDNLLAAPPPPPPPDVPALKAEHDGRLLNAREQLELHRSDPACAACHVRMDPIGFSLENFDAVGAWRKSDAGQPIDNAAVLPDGTQFAGITGLQDILMARKDEFTRAFTERLMTYALGRGIGAQDMPAIRAIAEQAAADDYRIRTIILGIVTSDAFTQRRTPERWTAADRRASR
jgi:hypothetical protein